MKIVGVAFTKGNLVLSMTRPKRHCDVIDASPIELHDWEQGFLLDNGDFANRRDGLRIARKAKQLKAGNRHSPMPRTFNELYSEDLW